MPAELDPSPQVIVVVKSATVEPALASVNVKDAAVAPVLSVPPARLSGPAVKGASATLTVESAVAVLLSVSTSVIVTVTA